MLSSILLAADSGSSGGGAAFQLIFFLIIGLLMYMVLIRPQRRRMRESQRLLSSLSEGDEVITTGGIYGFINAVEGDTLWIDIAEGVEIRCHRSAVARKVTPTETPAAETPETVDADDDSSSDED